ncbi:MAG TPA: ATP synthase F0 subunit C [Pirellulales bacterium]|nr:ATP synthase F0 subunit C [Pirellulales bacterium]
MKKFASSVRAMVAIAAIVLLPAMAQEVAAQEAASTGSPAVSQGLLFGAGDGMFASGAFGCGVVVIGGAYGIGRLAGSALESMARQPEVANNIQTAMIIAAALIEGFTFFALYICMTQNPFAK